MRPLGKAYRNAEATSGDFEKLPAGGYVCKITEVQDCPVGFDSRRPDSGNYLAIVYDIAEGPFKGYYSDEFGQSHKSLHTYYASYKESNLGRFKGFLKAIDESNGTNFEALGEKGLDEKQLVGKLIGITIGYEEYNSTRGTVEEGAKARVCMSADRIRKGEFKVPELKKLKEAPKAAVPEGFTPLSDEDVPFDL
jgi:hypothetical protein